MMQHKRDNEEFEFEHHRRDEDRSIPSWLYWLMTFINRLGFPIVVCVYLFYTQNSTMKELKTSMEMIATTIQNMATAVDKNTTAINDLKHVLHKRAQEE